MPKITNWEKKSDNFWKNEKTGTRVIVRKKSKEVFGNVPGYVIVIAKDGKRRNLADRTYTNKELARENARKFMKANPEA